MIGVYNPTMDSDFQEKRSVKSKCDKFNMKSFFEKCLVNKKGGSSFI